MNARGGGTKEGRLAGRRAIVTGAAGGIGAALARDVVVANAGGTRGEMIPFLELEPAARHGMIDRNLTSVYYCGLVCARQMASNASGAIVVRRRNSARSPGPA